jgi:AcrR family transcriptional regulator
MAKYVDPDERRREIAAAATDLLAAEGPNALTIRRIAASVSASTTVLTHYFSDKDDLVLTIFQLGAERSGERFDRARERGGDLRACLETLLPLDAERHRDWRLRAYFWGMAASDPELAREEARLVKSAHRRVETLLRERYSDMPREDVAFTARRLMTFVHGLGARNAVDPNSWKPSEMIRLLDHELSTLDAPADAPRPRTRAAANGR